MDNEDYTMNLIRPTKSEDTTHIVSVACDKVI
jgi:hypothetical protein